MPNRRLALITSLRETADACGHAQRVMADVESQLRLAASRLEEGGDIGETLITSRVKELRTDMQSAMDCVETTRHQFRLNLAAHCADMGMSAREISELWGFSRQRAQVLVQESRRSLPDEAPA
jgi:hypothetical protein